MKICKFCNEIMMSEYETRGNNSYFEFHNCQHCHAIYECTTKKIKKGREVYEIHENEKWWNPETKSWEE